LELHPDRQGVPPNVVLDGAHYKLVDQLEACVGDGVPSLLGCESLEIEGMVRFAPGVILRGKVVIKNPSDDRMTIPAGTYKDQTISEA
ncbi:MAG: UTP--glucose-1-phosphate uridylyltransferase, partial [Verrucomicrobiales bacterium]